MAAAGRITESVSEHKEKPAQPGSHAKKLSTRAAGGLSERMVRGIPDATPLPMANYVVHIGKAKHVTNNIEQPGSCEHQAIGSDMFHN